MGIQYVVKIFVNMLLFACIGTIAGKLRVRTMKRNKLKQEELLYSAPTVTISYIKDKKVFIEINNNSYEEYAFYVINNIPFLYDKSDTINNYGILNTKGITKIILNEDILPTDLIILSIEEKFTYKLTEDEFTISPKIDGITINEI